MPDCPDDTHPCSDAPAVPTRVTLPFTEAPEPRDVLAGPSATARYRIEGILGRGGMGEVLLAHDEQLDRPVALKRVKRTEGEDVAAGASGQLLREARTQARLVHPAFVPVFDVGTFEDGSRYFTMARVEGDTLDEVLRTAGAEGNPPQVRAKLLRVFAQVCQAVSRAHVSGIVHGDLKPANLMLGDHGQVFVIDLGIASTFDPDAAGDVGRALGGTPGYGAPEQFREGSPDPRWDVYALGAILFEILTGERLHRRGEPDEDVLAVYAASDPSPRSRRPGLDIAPELDALSVRALHLDPADRASDAHELAAGVERYLDGQRDHEGRQGMAQAYVARALEWHAQSLDPSNARTSLALWKRAMSSLGFALALVPADPGAATAMRRIMGELPPDVDRDVDQRLETWTQEHLRVALRAAGAAYATWSVCLPFILVMGVRDVAGFVGMTAAAVATVAWCAWASRSPHIAPWHVLVAATLSAATLVESALWFGPSIVTASAFVGNALVLGLLPTRGARYAALAITLVGMFAAAARDRWGGDPMLSIRDDVITIRAALTGLPTEIAWWAITLIPMFAAVGGSLVVARIGRSMIETTRREYRAHWHLAVADPSENARGDEPSP